MNHRTSKLLQHYEQGDKQIAVHGQVVGDILNFNEDQRKNSDENWQRADEDIKPVARIPRIVWTYLQTIGLDQDAEGLMLWLEKHPEWKRTEKRIANTRKTDQFMDLGQTGR